MRNWVRYSLAGSAIVIGVLMLLIVLGATRRAHARVSCERIEVRFEDEHRFFSEDDIRTFLDKRYGVYTGQPLDSVDLGRIEQLLEGRSAIRSCEAWTTDDGVLHLSILQRSPVVRFMNGEDGFYADAEGVVFPLFPSYTSPVRVVEGRADDDPQWVASVVGLVRYLDTHPAVGERIGQIAVRGGELTLFPVEGRERFLIGRPEDFRARLPKIQEYYDYISPLENNYQTINLKYNGQIICRKGI